MKISRCFALLFCASELTFAAGAVEKVAVEAQQEEDMDTVVLVNKNAPPIPPTKVTQDNYLQVIGTYKNSTVKKDSYLVKDVIYADRSSDFSTAIDRRDEGRYTLAALYFTKALGSMKDRKWAAEYCNYGIANAFYTLNIFGGYKGRTTTFAPAADYFKRVLEANPKSRFMLDTVVKIPVCYAEQEPPRLAEADAAVKEAEEYIKNYRKETGRINAGYGDLSDRALVQLAMAKARIAEKKVQKGLDGMTASVSRDLWHEARIKAAKFPDLQGDCVDGELRALIAMKQYEEAKTEASTIIDKFNQQSEYSMMALLPAAYTARGQAYLAQALEYEKKGNKPLANTAFADARWDFLNVIAQFFDNDEYVAAAHYLAGICYEKLKDVEPTDSLTKAKREWWSIVVNFPKSDYKDRAVAKLKELGEKVDEPPAAAPPKAAPPPQDPPKQDPPKKDPPKKEPGKKAK